MSNQLLPAGWKQSSLGEVVKIERESVQPESIQAGTAFVGLEHIDGEGNFNNIQSVNIGDIASNKFAFDSRHLLYGKLRPYLKKIARPNFQGICSTDILPILPSAHIDRSFLYYYLRQPQYIELATTRSTGANLPRLSPKTLAEFSISFPPLEEQKRIAAILDKADAIRRKRIEAIALTEELLRSTFLEMFGDPVTNPNPKKLPKGWVKTTVDGVKKDCKWSCVGGPFGSNLTSKDYILAPEIPVIRGINLSLKSCYLQEDEFVYVSKEKANSLKQNMAYPGDIIFTQRGTLGQVGMIAHNCHFERYLISQSQMKLTPNIELVDSIWLVSYFQSSIAQRIINQRTQATGVPHINLAILKEFPINLPPIVEQKKYSSFFVRHQSHLQKYKNAYLKSHNLFNSLLQKAFRGEL